MSATVFTHQLTPEEVNELSERERRYYERFLRERRNNTYRTSDDGLADVLPSAIPDGFGGSYGFKPTEPLNMKFNYAGRTATLSRTGKFKKDEGGSSLLDKMGWFYSLPLDEPESISGLRDLPTELEILKNVAAPAHIALAKGESMSATGNTSNTKQRLVMLSQGGKSVLSMTAACVFYSYNQRWLVIGSGGQIDLDKLQAPGQYVATIANPQDNSVMDVNVVNFGISMPNPLGKGAYAIFGVYEEDNGDNDQDGNAPDIGEGEEIVNDNATFL